MSEFRIPNPMAAVGDALREAMNPAVRDTGERATVLMDENFRAIEDNINSPNSKGTFLFTDDIVDNDEVRSRTWSMPGFSTTYHWSVSIYGDFPSDANVWLNVRTDGSDGGLFVGPGTVSPVSGFPGDFNAGCSVSGISSADETLEIRYCFTSATPSTVAFGILCVASPFSF